MKGNLWKVSDLLDETDIRFAQKDFFDLRSGYEYYGLTEKVIKRMAGEAGALYKIGTIYRVGLILSFGLLIVMGAIMCITFCFSAALKIMPYISGMLICLFLNTIVPFTKNLIPGHPFMNYCALLFIVESLISLLMHLKGTGKATALCFSEIMVGIISMFILDSVKPDSIGYCIFVTVIYVIGNMIFLTSNAAKYESNEKNSPVGIIISSLLYALAGYFIIAIPAELLWQKYIEYAFPSATVLFNIIYWVLRILVCGGIVVMGIKKARCSDKEILIIEDSVEITETENCNNQPY